MQTLHKFLKMFAATQRAAARAQSAAEHGGIFYIKPEGGVWTPAHNTVMLAGLDDIYSVYFNAKSAPAAFYIAPFSANTTPSSSLTAANFASTLGEYTGYTESIRPVWTPNGNASSQTVSNSSAPASITIGASAATIAGAGFFATGGTKGGTTGILLAAALFPAASSVGGGSTVQFRYDLAAAPKAA